LFGIIVQASIPNRPDWERTALMVSIDTEDHSPEATFFFEKLNPETWLPDPVEPFTLGPLKHPVKTKIPAGFYRVYVWTPDGRYHQVLRTVPKQSDDLPTYGPTTSFTWKNDAMELPTVRLFSVNERVPLVKITGGDFKTELFPDFAEKYSVSDLLVGQKEVTWGDLRRANIQLPFGMKDKPEAKDDEPVVGIQHSWATQLAEELGGEICNELVWRYCDSQAEELKRGPTGFRSLPHEATINLAFQTLVVGYEENEYFRVARAIGDKSADVGFRIYIRSQPPQTVKALMQQN
jgi:hypothetical protein